MRPNAKILAAAAAILLVVPVLLSGCIVSIVGIHHDRPPRMATLYVYARDYYSGGPIPFAHVEVSERDWWSWDYLGTWSVDRRGYAAARCGYLYYDGCGGREEEEYRVVAYARGYYEERYEIELSYHYPAETLTFYLMPYYARDAGESAPDVGPGTAIQKGTDVTAPAQAHGRVELGGTGEGEPDVETE
jgi:hypothetical protein